MSFYRPLQIYIMYAYVYINNVYVISVVYES